MPLSTPAYTILISQADVEQAVGGPLRLVQLCRNPTSPSPQTSADPTILNYAMQVASDRAVGILRIAGWTTDQIALMAPIDGSITRAVAMICAGVLGAQREEFRTAEGDFPFATQMKMGEKLLTAKTKPEERSTAEDDPAVGENPRLVSDTTPVRRRLFVAGKKRYPFDPGPGGF